MGRCFIVRSASADADKALDAQALCLALQQAIAPDANLHGIVVERAGKLQFEAYFCSALRSKAGGDDDQELELRRQARWAREDRGAGVVAAVENNQPETSWKAPWLVFRQVAAALEASDGAR